MHAKQARYTIVKHVRPVSDRGTVRRSIVAYTDAHIEAVIIRNLLDDKYGHPKNCTFSIEE